MVGIGPVYLKSCDIPFPNGGPRKDRSAPRPRPAAKCTRRFLCKGTGSSPAIKANVHRTKGTRHNGFEHHSSIESSSFLCVDGLLDFKMPAMKPSRDVREVIELIRHPRADSFLVSAHRGLRWGSTPENVKFPETTSCTRLIIDSPMHPSSKRRRLGSHA